MPRTSGRSSLTTTSPIRLRPSVRSVSRWFCLPPMPDRIWRHLEPRHQAPPPASRPRRAPEQRRRGDVLDRQPAAGGDGLRLLQRLQRRHRGVHDVDRVGRAERLAEHVVDAGALQHRAGRTARDHTGTGSGRAQHDHTGGLLTLDRVRDGALDPRHREERLLGLLDTLGDRRGHLLGLAVTDTDGAVAVADDDQRGEAEAPTALDDLGDPVDRDDPLDVGALVRRPTATLVAATVVTTAAVRRWGPLISSLLLVLASVGLLSPYQKPSPPSRAASASAAIRPWYLLPGPVEHDRVDRRRPWPGRRSARRPVLALSDLSPSAPRRSASIVDADASVRARPRRRSPERRCAGRTG